MLNSQTLDFLRSLADNNHKEWFEANRKTYEAIRKDLVATITELLPKMAAFDPDLIHLEAKSTLFRINRDIRFSTNKQPYKTNMGASMSPGGKNAMTSGYYLHIEPGNSFLAGGMYMPMAPQLAAVRQEIDYNIEEFKGILADKQFQQFYGHLSAEDKLKTAPKGYPKDHPEIELLKLKSFVVSHKLEDKIVLGKDLTDYCATVYQALQPLNAFLRRATDN